MTSSAAVNPSVKRLNVRALSPSIGAEITGADIAQDLDAETFRQIEQCWYEHLIILIRQQDLGEDEQVRFCGRFGPLIGSYNKDLPTRPGQHPSIMYVSNIRENGRLVGALPDGEMMFHSDQTHVEKPAMATMLYAMEIPSHGGDTLFANMYAAYEALSPDIKAKLEGLKAENVYDYDPATTMRRGSKIRDGVKHFAHPVVRTHPVTRRKALYVNRLMTDHIVGLPKEDSDELLNFLFDHSEEPRFVYTHKWKVGDLILWDNRCTQHARTDFDASERRKLRRITVQGERPF